VDADGRECLERRNHYLMPRTLKQRFGMGLSIDGPISITKKSQERYWGTLDYVENVKIFILRLRTRIWEDIGTIQITVPFKGEAKSGLFHATAYTRDRTWVLQRAWVEDDKMIIEIKRRIDLEFLLNPDEDDYYKETTT